MKFPFFKNFWHNAGYLFGALLLLCLMLCVGSVIVAATYKFIMWFVAL